jgi:hypothetical protein
VGLNYDGVVFHPVRAGWPRQHPTGRSVVDVRTSGRYHQVDAVVWAEISGPEVRLGRRAGTVGPDGVISAGYVQVMADGETVCGRLISRPTVLADGRIGLTEHWRRDDGSSGTSYLEPDLPGPD